MVTISDIRAQFADPTVGTRPLSIVHAFNRLLKRKADQDSDAAWKYGEYPTG